MTKFPILVLVLAATSAGTGALVPAPGAAQQPTQVGERRAVSDEDLRNVRSVSGLSLAPDGQSLAFVQAGAVWVIQTTPGSSPRRIAAGFGPTWSPSGGRLAFYANSGEPSAVQVFTADARTGEVVQVTHISGGVFPDRIAWSSQDVLAFAVEVRRENADSGVSGAAPQPASAERGFPLILGPDGPDGYALAGILAGVAPPPRAEPTTTELFVHDLVTGRTRQLTRSGSGFRSPAWSSDGELIACTTSEGFSDGAFVAALHLVDGNTGSSRPISPGAPRAVDPQWSPDGRRLAFASYSRTDLRASGINIVDIDEAGRAGLAIQVVSNAISDYAWAGDGASLFVTQVDGVTQPVRRFGIADGSANVVGSAGYVARTGSLTTSRSGAIAWAESRGDVPVVVRLLRPGAREAEAIYDPNPQMRNVMLGHQEIVRWTNRHGHDRQGILILPVDFQVGQRYPLIVSAYSEGSHLNAFQSDPSPAFGSQRFAVLGYVVFFPGPRVPWMYGGAASDDPVGGPSGWDLTIDDVESGVDVLIERGIVDADRMAIMGFSNGGAAAAAMVTRSSRYRAAVSVAPANLNWLESAMRQDNMGARWIPTKTFVGIEEDILENPLPYLAGSPVFQLKAVETPLLLAVGDRDDASFTIPTIEFYLGLRRLGKDVTLLRYAGMPHGFFGPAADDLNRRILAFLDQHLGVARRSPSPGIPLGVLRQR